MRQRCLQLLFLAVFASLSATAAISSITTTEGSGRRQTTWKSQVDDKTVEFTTEGEVVLNDEGSDVQLLTPGSRLTINETRQKEKRTLEITRNPDGTLQRKYLVKKKELPYAAEAKAWYAEILAKAIREWGFQAAARAQSLLKQGGVEGLEKEVGRLGNDFVKRLYLGGALKSKNLAPEDAARLLNIVRKELSSDFEKRVALDAAPRALLEDDKVAAAYLETTAEIRSDFEKRLSLNRLFKDTKLTETVLTQSLAVAHGLRSDFERTQFLETYLKQSNGSLPKAFFDLVSGMNSDFHRNQVLRTVVEKRELASEAVEFILKGAHSMGSDFERSRLLMTLVEKHPRATLLSTSFFNTLTGFRSSFEQKRVLSEAIKQPALPEPAIHAILRVAQSMKSDFDKSGLLMDLVPHCAGNESLQKGLVEAAKSIESESDRGRVLAKIFK